MTKSIGLTGSMGSGKSLIARVFQELGAEVFYADIEAKKLYEDNDFLEEIRKEFGDIVVRDNKLNRAELANIVFNNRERLEKLNSMVHPKVLENYNIWLKSRNTKYVIHESAILFESGWAKSFDKIICIDTPEDIIIERVMLRDNITQEEVRQRLRNQMPIKEKKELSDYIIKHDNKIMLLPQIIEIHKELINK